jgi:hypothetical protein
MAEIEVPPAVADRLASTQLAWLPTIDSVGSSDDSRSVL